MSATGRGRAREIWFDPEIDQGFGLSGTFGVAGFPERARPTRSAKTYPYARVPRAFLRQTIDLGGDVQKVDAGINQFAGSQTTDRLVITVGKFGVVDIFDKNKYAHDPRGDFLNWTVVNTGAFDYAADAWAFTYGAAAEWYTGQWTLRAGGLFDGPVVPNSTDLDPSFGQFQMVGEIERRYDLGSARQDRRDRLSDPRAALGSFQDAVELAALTGIPPDITAVRKLYQQAGAASLQHRAADHARHRLVRARRLSPTATSRPMHSPMSTAPWPPAPRCRASYGGGPTTRSGIAGVVNSITKEHQAYSRRRRPWHVCRRRHAPASRPRRSWKPTTVSGI